MGEGGEEDERETGGEGIQNAEKYTKKGLPKSGLGDRQVGAFSVFGVRHTGIPFIFWPFFAFFRKIDRFRG